MVFLPALALIKAEEKKKERQKGQVSQGLEAGTQGFLQQLRNLAHKSRSALAAGHGHQTPFPFTDDFPSS